MEHNLKVQAKWLARILTKEKTFEVRNNDRDYQVGDTIRYLPLKDDNVDVYKIRSPLPAYKIIYVHSGLGMADGYVVLGITESN
jgi:hypothetical protein